MGARNYEGPVATAPASASARTLAKQLADYSLGCVVIADEKRRPLGIVTDRDLLVRVVAAGRDPDGVCAEELMTRPLVTAHTAEPIDALVERMAVANVRRLPVLDEERLVGLVALDDLLVWLVRELDDLSEATRREITEGWKQARRERKSADLEKRIAELRDAVRAAGEDAVELASRELQGFRDRLNRLLGRSAESAQSEVEGRDGKEREA